MILEGGRVALGPDRAVPLDVGVDSDRLSVPAAHAGGPRFDARGLLILPGLINAHDHLEFNLFPRLGNGPYPNATCWARDIYRPGRPPLREHLSVPKSARLLWGALKNLVCGVTTVMHHNPYAADFDADFPVRVVKRCGWAHSIEFSPDFADRHRRTTPGVPFLMHAGEGTDRAAATEVHTLARSGVLRPGTALVHGVAFDDAGFALIGRRGAALVWCPTSNQFTLGRSLPAAIFASGLRIALGTDSALTARGDMVDEAADAAAAVGWTRVYGMLTADAASILRLSGGEGTIRDGGVADLVAVPDHGQTPAAALCGLRPELVVVRGQVKLISPASADRVSSLPEGLHRLTVEGRGCWLVNCDVPALLERSVQALGDDLRLCGRRVTC